MKTKKVEKVMLIASICIMLVFSAFGYFVNTSAGKVDVQEINFQTEFGQMSGLVYKPVAATSARKAPAVVLSHGYLNSREMQDQASIELSRRGYVVFAMDAYGHGHSTFNVETENVFALLEMNAGGMWDAVNYLYKQPYVANTKIAVAGHSLGGLFVNASVAMDNAAMAAGEPQKIVAVMLAGCEPAYDEGYYGNRSVGVLAAQYDEFFFDYGGTAKPRDFLSSENAKVFVNQVLPEGEKLGANDVVKNGLAKLNDSVYKNAQGVVRAIYNPAEIHPWNHFSIDGAKAYINYFGSVSNLRPSNYLASINTNETAQTWWLKETFNGVALVAFFVFIISAVALFIQIPALSLAEGKGESANPPTTKGKKAVYWVGFALTIVISAISFLVVTTMIGETELMKGMSMNYGDYFSQPVTNELIGWALVSAVVGIAVFVASFFINKKLTPAVEGEVKPTFKQLCSTWGIVDRWQNVLKALAVALGVVVLGYILVFFTQWLFAMDFRLWVVAVKTFEKSMILTALKYVPFFAIYFIVSSFVVNTSVAVKGRKEIYNYLLIIAAVVGGVAIITLIQYVGFAITGTRPFINQNLRPLLGFSLVPILSVSAIITRFCYNRTGKIWLGAFVNTLLITLITVANTVTMYA